jgi:hypothetical protein
MDRYGWALVAMGGDRPPQAWNLYHTETEALVDMRKGIREQNAPEGRAYATVMPTEDYRKARRGHYLAPTSNPLRVITAAQWDEALNVLPPLRWGQRDGVERFCMSEFYSDTLTHQYARVGSTYCTRLVDYRDEATWITAVEVLALREGADAHV